MACIGNYLRVRGEYHHLAFDESLDWELPPRTRRIRQFQQLSGLRLGTTSAYAENTHDRQAVSCTPRNYLRVRGEYGYTPDTIVMHPELPPRTRRILAGEAQRRTNQGTTSAYAENTLTRLRFLRLIWNYLRVRGEYISSRGLLNGGSELPPRTRRILDKARLDANKQGTTSAYAENTACLCNGLICVGNYLRVRGEYLTLAALWSSTQELPPRTRRIPSISHVAKSQVGTTSAYAENTTPLL